MVSRQYSRHCQLAEIYRPKDKRLKKLGVLELLSLNRGFEAYIARGWTQVLNIPLEDCRALIAKAKREANNPRYHTYCHL